MPEELKPFVPAIVGLGIFFLILCFFSWVFVWFWTHPAILAVVVAAGVWFGYQRARRARV
jgi:hypothetical protein